MKEEKETKNLTPEELKKILEKAIDERLEKEKKFMATGSKKHLTDYIKTLEFDKDSAVVLLAYNKKTEELAFKSIKASASDIQGMCLYALSQTDKRDGANFIDGVSTLMRLKELTDCWVEHNVKEEEYKDGE